MTPEERDAELKKRIDKSHEPFLETTLSIEKKVEKIRETLGDEEASKINDLLIDVQSNVKKAEELHVETLTEHVKISDRNKELVEVNNDLYIKNSHALKGTDQSVNNELDMDDLDSDDALDNYSTEVMKGK